jgi:hypothetical protein
MLKITNFLKLRKPVNGVEFSFNLLVSLKNYILLKAINNKYCSINTPSTKKM